MKLLQEGLGSLRGAIGTPEQIAELAGRYEAAGVDEVIFVGQAGKNRHEDICESIELFGKEVLPRFAERADEKETAKRARLAQPMEGALGRRSRPRSADPSYVITSQGEPAPARTVEPSRSDGDAEGTASRVARLRQASAALLQQKMETGFESFVRGRSDGQLERTIGSRIGLQTIFNAMARRFEPDKSGGFKGDIQYELGYGDGTTRRWVVRIYGDRAEARPATSPHPALTLRLSLPTFARLLARELPPAEAFMQGRIEIEGDFQVAVRLGEMFGQGTPF